MISKNIKYLVGVDHLRGFAALLVVLYHGTQLIAADITHKSMFNPATDYVFTNWNPIKSLIIEGHFGVSLFMTLSGFIFTFGLLGRTFNRKGFFKNRFIRIFPLYIFLVFLTVSLYGSGPDTLSALLGSVLPFANIPGVGLSTGIIASAAMFWTIAVEVQFYLIFPFLIGWLNSNKVRVLIGIVGTFMAFRLIAALAGDVNMINFAYFSIFGRIDQFIMGMLVGYIFVTDNPVKSFFIKHKKMSLTISVISLLGLLLTINRLRAVLGPQMFENLYVVLPTIEAFVAGLLILSYVLIFQKKTSSIVSILLAKLGEISYSLYLTHFIVLTLLVGRLDLPNITGNAWWSALLYTLLIALPGCIALSLMTYNFIEKPFLTMRQKYTHSDED